jgi:hypothetical protein
MHVAMVGEFQAPTAKETAIFDELWFRTGASGGNQSTAFDYL